MDNDVLKKATNEDVRKGITEGQWSTLTATQKYNWRVALYGVVAIFYLILYVSSTDLMSLGRLPIWVSHSVGVYSSCCFLLLTAGEREYSALPFWHRKLIDVVWRMGLSLFFLSAGLLFVAVIASVMWKAVAPPFIESLPKELYPEWLIMVLIGIALAIVIYRKFKVFLISCFRVPQIVGQSWLVADKAGSVVPLALVEVSLALALPLGHILVVSMLKALLSLWN